MAKSGTYETDILGLLLNATPISGIADNAATSPATDLYVALHTADPGTAGTQTTNEVAYTGYARVAVSRSNTAAAWTISGTGPATANPNATIAFPSATGGTATATYFSIGSASTGAGTIYYSGAISPTISISSGVTPELTTSTAISES